MHATGMSLRAKVGGLACVAVMQWRRYAKGLGTFAGLMSEAPNGDTEEVILL